MTVGFTGDEITICGSTFGLRGPARRHPFTCRLFLAKRVVLVLSLVITLLVLFEGIKTELAMWSLHFAVLFIATVPLHILHKKTASMLAETATLVILLYGSMKVFAH